MNSGWNVQRIGDAAYVFVDFKRIESGVTYEGIGLILGLSLLDPFSERRIQGFNFGEFVDKCLSTGSFCMFSRFQSWMMSDINHLG